LHSSKQLSHLSKMNGKPRRTTGQYNTDYVLPSQTQWFTDI
jgi:hypothetical protein